MTVFCLQGGFRVKAFYGAKILLEGFEPVEKSNMNKLIEENGGETAEIFDSTVTHIVSIIFMQLLALLGKRDFLV